MGRNEFMELVYETFADEPDNVLANGIIEAADAYAEHEKAQLSKEGTTSDLISRQAAIDALAEQMPTPYTPDGSHPADEQIFQVQEVYADCITTIKLLPTIQPVATDTNVGDNSEIPNSSKGHWIFVHPLQEDDTGAYMRSECKVGNWEIDPESYFSCQNCGADMRGEKDG